MDNPALEEDILENRTSTDVARTLTETVGEQDLLLKNINLFTRDSIVEVERVAMRARLTGGSSVRFNQVMKTDLLLIRLEDVSRILEIWN